MKKKVTALFLMLCVALTATPIFAARSESKIDSELLTAMAEKSDSELIPVWIWLEDLDEDIITDALIEEKGLNPSNYESEQRFNDEVVSEITQQIENSVGYEEAHKEIPADKLYSNSRGTMVDTEFVDAPITLIDKAIDNKIEEYVSARREIVKRECSNYNKSFVEKYLAGQEQKILYNSEYTPTLVIKATKAEINNYAKDKMVNEISAYTEVELTPDINFLLDHVYAGYNDNGTKNYYKGTGVTVGILEADSGKINSASPHLTNALNSGRVTISNDAGANGTAVSASNSTHATGVTSIITGDAVTYSGMTFEGVVPLATVYQTPVSSNFMPDSLRGFQKLADKGASVINFSASNKSSGSGYVEFDKEIDRLIAATGVTFVNTPGNGNSRVETKDIVNSPGKALNSITVGNAKTKESSFSDVSKPYDMYISSSTNTLSYVVAPYLANKPDITAPGTNMSYFYTNTQLVTGSGTSFAAPIVTGVIAQMMQINPWLKTNPSAVKAKLLLAADDSSLKLNDKNPIATDSQYLRDMSGAGFLDAIAAVNAAKSKYDVDMSIDSLKEQKSQNYYFKAGQKIRAVMAYSKENTNYIQSQADMDIVDFYLRKSDGTNVASSVSDRNNVRVIEYQVEDDGYYYFSANPRQLVKNEGEDNYAGVKAHISFQFSDLRVQAVDLKYEEQFKFSALKFSDAMLTYRNKSIYVTIKKYNSDASVTTLASDIVSMNNAGIGIYNSLSDISLDVDEYIEILMYADSDYKNQISRGLIYPVLF